MSRDRAEQVEGSSHGVSDGNISPVIMDQFGWENATGVGL